MNIEDPLQATTFDDLLRMRAPLQIDDIKAIDNIFRLSKRSRSQEAEQAFTHILGLLDISFMRKGPVLLKDNTPASLQVVQKIHTLGAVLSCYFEYYDQLILDNWERIRHGQTPLSKEAFGAMHENSYLPMLMAYRWSILSKSGAYPIARNLLKAGYIPGLSQNAIEKWTAAYRATYLEGADPFAQKLLSSYESGETQSFFAELNANPSMLFPGVEVSLDPEQGSEILLRPDIIRRLSERSLGSKYLLADDLANGIKLYLGFDKSPLKGELQNGYVIYIEQGDAIIPIYFNHHLLPLVPSHEEISNELFDRVCALLVQGLQSKGFLPQKANGQKQVRAQVTGPLKPSGTPGKNGRGALARPVRPPNPMKRKNGGSNNQVVLPSISDAPTPSYVLMDSHTRVIILRDLGDRDYEKMETVLENLKVVLEQGVHGKRVPHLSRMIGRTLYEVKLRGDIVALIDSSGSERPYLYAIGNRSTVYRSIPIK